MPLSYFVSLSSVSKNPKSDIRLHLVKRYSFMLICAFLGICLTMAAIEYEIVADHE